MFSSTVCRWEVLITTSPTYFLHTSVVLQRNLLLKMNEEIVIGMLGCIQSLANKDPWSALMTWWAACSQKQDDEHRGGKISSFHYFKFQILTHIYCNVHKIKPLKWQHLFRIEFFTVSVNKAKKKNEPPPKKIRKEQTLFRYSRYWKKPGYKSQKN